jgi:non-ribosomal peptide synthetase component F
MQKTIINSIRPLISRHHKQSKLCLASRKSYATLDESAKYLNPFVTKTHARKSYALSIPESFFLLPETIGERIEASALERPDEICYVFPHNRDFIVTFKELKQRVDTMAQNLLNLGFAKGDRVAFVLPNTSELVIGSLACASIGCVSVVLNLGYQAFELEYMLKKTGAKGVVIYDTFRTLKHLETLTQLCPEINSSAPGELKSVKLPSLKHVFVINSPFSNSKQNYKGTWSYDQLANPMPGNRKIESPHVDIDDPCFILFTVSLNFILFVHFFSKIQTNIFVQEWNNWVSQGCID